MRIRLWFNNWFNMAYHFIHLLKDNPDGTLFDIFGTNQNPYSAVLKACDYSEIEPVLQREKYIDYCLDFCRRNKIDVFLPYKNISLISEYVKSFEEVGTKVLLCGDNETIKSLVDKAEFYGICKKHNLAPLPDYHIVNTADKFLEAYEDLKRKGHEVCIKPVCANGGAGFRIVKSDGDRPENLFGHLKPVVSRETVYKILSTAGKFRDLMVLEYLSGYEYSLDTLALNGNIITVIPRKKDSRLRILEENQELIEIAEKLTKAFSLSYAFNIQVKFNQGIPKLLEINPRMSAGTHLSSLSGVNIPYIAVKLLLDGRADVPKPEFGIRVINIRTEMVYENNLLNSGSL